MRRRRHAAALIAVLAWGFIQSIGYAQEAPPPAAPGAVPAPMEQPEAVAPPTMAGPFQQPSPVPQQLSLDDAIAIALRNNPNTTIARENIRAAAGALVQAGSAVMPQLTTTSERTTPVNLPAFSFQSTTSTWQTTFSLGVLLYNWGAAQNSIRAARRLVDASQDTYLRTQEQIAFVVRQDYFGVLTAAAAVVVAQDVVNSAQEHLRIARLRYEAGVAPQFDVLAAEARVARVQQGLIAAEGNLNVAWASLAQVLGVAIPPGTVLSTPRPVAPTTAELPTLLETAFGHRADLAAAVSQQRAAERQLKATRVGELPTFSAALSYSLRPKTTVTFGAPPEQQTIVVSQNSGFIVFAATWPMFTGGLVAGETETARARVAQAQQNVQLIHQQIQFDVRSAFFNVQSAQAQIVAAESEVAQAREALRIANLRYQEGVGTSVEVIDAEATLEDARTRLNQAIFGLNLAVAQLDLATGTGLALLPAPAPAAPPTAAPAAAPGT